jgi:hypothetical protein
VVIYKSRSQGSMATASRSHPDPGTQALAPGVGRARHRGWWLRGWRWETWIGSGKWPVRPRVIISKVITVWSSANLKLPPLLVVLDLPVVAADYAEQISHGSPSSTSVWMALTLHGSGSLGLAVPRLLVCWRACLLLACPVPVTLRNEHSRPDPLRRAAWRSPTHREKGPNCNR